MTQRARTSEAKEARRALLLQAALDEFYERGFSGARIDDIARRVGLSKGTLYLYFESKHALFTELVRGLTAAPVAKFEELVSAASSVDVALRAFAEFAAHILTASNLPRLMKVLIGDSHAFPDTITAYRKAVLDPVLTAIASMLEAAKGRGEISINDPFLTARLIVAPVAFSGIWFAVFDKGADASFDARALLREHVELITRAISVNGDLP